MMHRYTDRPIYGKKELTGDEVKALKQAADASGSRVTLDYSGRGMYGATCVGVVVDYSYQLADFILELSSIDRDLAGKLTTGTSQDSMGLGAIFYWPRITATQAVLDAEWVDERDAD